MSPAADIFLFGSSVSNMTAVSQAEAMPGDFTLYLDLLIDIQDSPSTTIPDKKDFISSSET